MLSLFQYSAANACVQGGLGRLLEADEWNRFLARETLDEMISMLGATIYGDAVVDVRSDIEAVEMRLRRALAERIHLPLPFLRGTAKALIEHLRRRFEIDNLIIVLRAHHNQEPAHRIAASLLELGPSSLPDWEELRKAKSVSGVIDSICRGSSGMEYCRPLRNAFNEYKRQSTIHILEISLYIDYYRKLCRLLSRLRGRDRRAAERLIGTMIDFRNLQWAYRYRTFFKLAPESILSYTTPEGGCVDTQVIQRVATGAPLSEIVPELWGPKLPGLERIKDKQEREAVVELEVIFRRYLYREAGQMLKGYPLHLGMSLAYVILLEAEVDDLISVIEGRLNGWSAERIRSELIGDRGVQ